MTPNRTFCALWLAFIVPVFGGFWSFCCPAQLVTTPGGGVPWFTAMSPAYQFLGPCGTLITGGPSCPLQFTDTPSQPSAGNDIGYTKLATSFKAPWPIAVCEIDLYLIRSGSPSGTMTVSIYSDNSGQPGSIIGTASSAVNPSSIQTGVFTLIPFVGVSANIAPGPWYWIVLSMTA